MDVFVARQPILDVSKSVYAYELLFRSGPENYFPDFDPDAAASRVITDSVSVFGMDSLTAGKRAFVNVTRRVLTEGLFSFLPQEWVVVELLETINVDDEVVAACKALKRAGYSLAIDDFDGRPDVEPLIKLVDFLKIDFLATDARQRSDIAERYGSDVRLLAEKVETYDDVQEGLDLGFELFQGYFFCRPQIVVRREVPAFKLNYLRFVREMMRPELDLDELERLIKQEVSLSVRLLRVLNSAAFGYNGRVNSVREALILLGERRVRKWSTMIALSEIGDESPQALLSTCLTRARFCELMACSLGMNSQSDNLFLVGMFSLVDALVGRPLPELLGELAVSNSIRDGLLKDSSTFGRVRSLVVALEQGDWDAVGRLTATLETTERSVWECYADALVWASEIFKE